ncbi:STAS domain-containing protein [Kribbella sp. VKM Ac-2568]|uniref:STAS domain-containing protein n=1 Tax=Kribbella sp. VKM Ac-2568 TaxID=2512219 RepID=UPI001044FE16|nr:STAS domain-containing protein [Kribbella sp. VKM Ac-2568]TCM49362.1 anti-anti-sigma factor [Kribbella sp. VKM Ac-2568]
MLDEEAPFSLTVDTTGPAPVVRVSGDLDLETSPELTDQLKVLLGPHLLVIDLTDVEFMDSTGLGVLVGAHKESSSRGGSLALVGAQHRVQKILRITKLHKVFTLYPTLDALAEDLATQLLVPAADGPLPTTPPAPPVEPLAGTDRSTGTDDDR